MSIIAELELVIRDRQTHPRDGSYTCHLFERGLTEIAKKVGEEAVEVIVASLGQQDERLTAEAADLIYHLLVLLTARGIPWSAVEKELSRRRGHR